MYEELYTKSKGGGEIIIKIIIELNEDNNIDRRIFYYVYELTYLKMT